MKIFLEYNLPAGQILRIGQGDITEETTEAIVNAANERLEHGAGVAGAIRKRGGEIIQEESHRWVQEHGRVHTGSAAITGAGSLATKYVIHTVGPIWGSGNEEKKLASAVKSALSVAAQHGIKSIAIPGISSGIFGGPKDLCARIIIQTTANYLNRNPATSIKEVHFCNIDEETVSAFLLQAKSIFESKL
ncbi:MAG: macro domain-containing protein [Anaerolineaceae bacterium]|nr:macro domain-containing protein [Anaerolineaceae bacterium]